MIKDDEVRRGIIDLQGGRIGTCGDISLAVSPATSTTVITRACSSGSTVLLMPKDAGAATEVGNGTLYIVPDKGQFVVNHSSSASARTFRFAIFTNIKPLS